MFCTLTHGGFGKAQVRFTVSSKTVALNSSGVGFPKGQLPPFGPAEGWGFKRGDAMVSPLCLWHKRAYA